MKPTISFLFVLFPLWVQAQEIKLILPVKFLALGDSYTIGQSVPESQRWPVQLVDELQRNSIATEELRIIAQTGWRTDNLISAVRAANLTEDYNLVSLLIGVNNQYQGSDFEQYEREFAELLQMAVNLAGGDRESVFVISIPDYGYTPFGESNRQTISAQIDKYNKTNKAISLQYGVAYINITPVSRQGLDKPEYVASDGLHPSGEMYAEWVKLIMEELYIGQTSAANFYAKSGLEIQINTADSKIYIQNAGLDDEALFYRIRKITGAVVQAGDIRSAGIGVSDLASGLYFIEINGANHRLAAKFILP